MQVDEASVGRLFSMRFNKEGRLFYLGAFYFPSAKWGHGREALKVAFSRGTTETYHDSNCQKCRLKSHATNLSIAIDEWPLPSDALQAKSAVFELFLSHSVTGEMPRLSSY